jgi:hypothetical protein
MRVRRVVPLRPPDVIRSRSERRRHGVAIAHRESARVIEVQMRRNHDVHIRG